MKNLEFLEKIANDRYQNEDERQAFVESFLDKMASFSGVLTSALSSKGIGEGVGRALGGLAVGVAGAALAKGILSTTGAVSNMALRSKFETALAQVMVNNRIVKAADPARAKGYAETIFKFAPHVASDPNVLSSVLANVIHGDGVDPQTIKMITDLEGRYKDNQAPGNFPRF